MRTILQVMLALVAIVVSAVAGAGVIDANCAALAARTWACRGGLLGARIGTSVERTDRHETDSGAAFYAVRMVGGGLVITSADSEENPIVAFLEGTNVLEAVCEGSPLRSLLNRRLVKKTAAVAARPAFTAMAVPEPSAASRRWASLTNATPRFALTSSYIDGTEKVVGDLRVPPLTKSKWNQGSGGRRKTWNHYTPNGHDCGCVATAMAQVMYYHRWPTSSLPQKTYKCACVISYDPYSAMSTNMTMKGGIYAWDFMVDQPSSNPNIFTAQNAEAMGRLTYDCGVSVRMTYGERGSAAFGHYAANQLKNLFGYASATYFDCYNGWRRGYGEQADLLTNNLAKVIFTNLDAGCPVMLGIDGDSGGHEIVGDGYGYNDGLPYVHLNLGWGAIGNVWYNLPDMHYDAQKSFNMVDEVIYNIIPGTVSNLAVFSGRVTDADGKAVSNVPVRIKEVFGGKTTTVTNVTCNAYGVYGASFLPKSGAAYRAEVTGVDGYEDGQSIAVSVAAPNVKTELMGYEEEIERLVFKGEDAGNSWGNDIVLTSTSGSGESQPDESDPETPDPETPALVTNRVPVTVSLGFAMTADNNMKVAYDVATNGISRSWEDPSFVFTESGAGRNLWRGTGNTNIESGVPLVKNFGGYWGGYPVPNTNLEQPGGYSTDRFWEIDVPFDLGAAYSVTNIYPKAFITTSNGTDTDSGQPVAKGKRLDVTVSVLSADKSQTEANTTVRTGVLGAQRVNAVVGDWVTTLSNGVLRIRVEHAAGECTGAFAGIQGIVFCGELVTVSGATGGGDGPGPVTPVEPGTNVVVAPLTQAMWNQGRHYNLMCPTTATGGCDGRMWAGCTAVATAIVMKYYGWPREGETFYQTLNDEKSWETDYTTVAQRARFYRPYEWSKMQDVYGNVTSAEASLAVGELIADIGAAMNMNYGAGGSSTLRDNVLDVLEHNFHFDASEMYHVESSNFTPEVEKMIQAQLREGHPIISAGAAGKSGTGHTYVCDGYEQVVAANGTTNFLYHFNFGWGGGSNGWYPLGAVFTSAEPGEEAYARPVQDMFLGVYPQKAPQIHSAPDVTGPEVRLDWSMATCWTNRVTGVRVEDLMPTTVAVNEDLSGCWSVRATGYGWDLVGSRPSAKIVDGFYSWSPTSWPNMGINANTTNAVAVSADTTITISYQARKFKDNVKLYLIKSNLDGLSYDESNNYADFPCLAELPGGDSENQLTDKTVTVDGSVLASAFGNEPAIFALMFSDDNGGGSYAAGTEVFRLVSFVVSGQGQKWEAIESWELGPESRGCTMGNRTAGDHKFAVTALYPDREAASSVEKTVRSSEPMQPTVALTSASGKTLTFAVGNTSNYSFKFETQGNVMRGTGTKNGNAVTYTFVNDVATMGTHWIALTVTDNATGASARYVHITNPPADHPLCAYTERSVEAAVARARREGKLVLLMESGDPEAKKFMALSGVLASNEVVEAVSKKYVVAETIASVPDQRVVGQTYWRAQPQAYGAGLTSYQPDITAYAVVINPETPSVPYPCDTLPSYYMNASSRWYYFNSQYDISNLGYDFYIASATSELVRFLGQDKFVVTLLPVAELEPTIVDGDLVGTIAANDDGEYVVTPTMGTWYVAVKNAGDHTVVVPPSVMAVSGVSRDRLKVKAGVHEITSAFLFDGNAENGYFLTLAENGVVTNGNEKIAVRPELSPVGSDELATTPFAVSEDVSVGVKTIPGLKYVLLRGEDIQGLRTLQADPSSEGVASQVAQGTRTLLKDTNPPKGRAFYLIRVAVPVNGD